MVVGLLGNKSSDSNRFTLVTPKPEIGVRLQATLQSEPPTGLPVGAVSQGPVKKDKLLRCQTKKQTINKTDKDKEKKARILQGKVITSLKWQLSFILNKNLAA